MGLLNAAIELVDDLIGDAKRSGRLVRDLFGRHGILLIAILALLAALVLAYKIPVFSRVLDEDFWDESNGANVRSLVWAGTTLVAGLVGFAGYMLLAIRTQAVQRQTDLQEQSHITERFTKAIEQLGHEKRAVRLGALYALERIAKDSERDFETIIETLAAYVREQVPRFPGSVQDAMAFSDESAKTKIDVVAAIEILARSIPKKHPIRLVRRVDLRATNLSGMELKRLDLSGFEFSNAKLSGARFIESNVENVLFMGTDLSDAFFFRTNVDNANFYLAKVGNARMRQVYNMGSHQLIDAEYEGDLKPRSIPDNVRYPQKVSYSC